jgi:hypothetical protein
MNSYPVILSQMPCLCCHVWPSCPVILSRLSCPGFCIRSCSVLSCPVSATRPSYPVSNRLPRSRTVSGFPDPSCPVSAVFFLLCCLCYHVLIVNSYLSCFDCPSPDVLSLLSCSSYRVLIVWSWLFCYVCQMN